ncbi:sulfate permease, SulP family [Pancytospora philotis]|nr:sulfate permease, SulP family [Pancytospora philotis]
MGAAKQSSSLLNLLTSFLSLLVFVSIDYFSIGLRLFSWDGGEDAPSTTFLSSTVFLLTTYFAQVVYAFCSSIRTGIAASIVFEAALISRQIAAACYSTLKTDKGPVSPADFYANVLLCVGISTFIFAMLSFIPYLYGLGDYFKDLPFLAVFSVMTSIGISILRDAVGDYLSDLPSTASLALLGISLAAGFVLLCTEFRFPDFAFLIPLAAALITTAFNVIFRLVLGMPSAKLREAGYIVDFGESADLKFWHILSLFKGASISYQCVLRNISNILSLVLFNLIHINTNVVPYAFFTKTPVDLNREWRTQGIANLLTAFTGFPSYFVSSTSILFYKSGARCHFASCLGTLVPIVLALGAPYFRDYIPAILSSIILSYLGFSFIYSYYVRIRGTLSSSDFGIITLGVVFCQCVSFAAGFAIVSAIAAIIALRYYSSMLGCKAVPAPASLGVVRVDYVLCFMTLSRLKLDLPPDAQEVTLDLSACPYVDMNGNLFLVDLARTLQRLRIVGSPCNLYGEMLRRETNVHVSEVYY